MTRALDDLILRLRSNKTGLGTWVLRTEGATGRVLAYDEQLRDLREDWFVNEVVHYYKRTLKRLDVTSQSLIAVIEPAVASPACCWSWPWPVTGSTCSRGSMRTSTRRPSPPSSWSPAATTAPTR